jgi:hypothetical protein
MGIKITPYKILILQRSCTYIDLRPAEEMLIKFEPSEYRDCTSINEPASANISFTQMGTL